MSSQTNSMTTGSPLRLIFFFSLPLMAGNILQQLYTAIDSIIVGQGVGIAALAALGASDWIYWLFLWSIHGLTQGFSILVAQSFGAGDYNKLRKIICTIILLCGIFSIILTTIALLALNPLLHLLNTPTTIFYNTRLYLRILFSANTIVIAYNMTAAISRSLGNSRLPLIALVFASILNIVLDMIFVLVFHWGIVGAATATVIAQLFALFICIRGLCHIQILKIHRDDWKIDLNILKKLCSLGIPLSLQNGFIAIGGMFVQNVLNGLGMEFIAGFTATNKLVGILESIASSFGYGLSTYIGQNYGAGKISRLNKGIRAVLLLSAIFSISISAIMIIFGRPILGLFIATTDIAGKTALSIAYNYLLILCWSLFILFLVHIYRNALQGLGNIIGPILSGIAEMSLRTGVALILPNLIGVYSIFYCETAAWTGAAVTLILTYYLVIKRIKQSITLNDSTIY